MSEIDFGRHSEDYASHRPGFPSSFYRRLDAISRLDGSRALDLATGPGTVALELAALGSSVVGIDTSAEQIAAAQRIAEDRGLEDSVDFMVARAEDTGLDRSSFDLATAGQCWHWFDSDAAMAEVRRVLRPGGVLAIAYFSYLAGVSPVARDTEDLVLRFNPEWAMAGSTGVFPERIEQMAAGGLIPLDEFSYIHQEQFSHIRWRGRMRTCNGVGSGGLTPPDVWRAHPAR